MNDDAEHWIRTLGLAPHPEGGWFREVHRSTERIESGLPARFPSARPFLTSILFQLCAGERSRFHRLAADEVWFHHAGGSLRLHLLEGAREYRILDLGPGQPQVVVPHGTWFAAEPEQRASFALVGCAVAPGFAFEDFELASRRELLQRYAEHADVVRRFTVPEEES